MFHSLPAVGPECVQDPHFSAPPDVPLKMDFVMQQIQTQLLDGTQEMAVLADTGDSMFRCGDVLSGWGCRCVCCCVDRQEPLLQPSRRLGLGRGAPGGAALRVWLQLRIPSTAVRS